MSNTRHATPCNHQLHLEEASEPTWYLYSTVLCSVNPSSLSYGWPRARLKKDAPAIVLLVTRHGMVQLLLQRLGVLPRSPTSLPVPFSLRTLVMATSDHSRRRTSLPMLSRGAAGASHGYGKLRTRIVAVRAQHLSAQSSNTHTHTQQYLLVTWAGMVPRLARSMPAHICKHSDPH